jgi:hypothetical protein
MDSPHSCMSKVHLIIATSSIVSTLIGPTLIWFFHLGGQQGSSLGCSMTCWPSLKNVSLCQQHPLLIIMFHLSRCHFWVFKAFNLVVVLIFCFMG